MNGSFPLLRRTAFNPATKNRKRDILVFSACRMGPTSEIRSVCLLQIGTYNEISCSYTESVGFCFVCGLFLPKTLLISHLEKITGMKRKHALLVLVCLVAFFVNNAALRPDIMECRNLVTAREIANGGNWLLPTMNGGLRLEKPPLPTWIAAAVESVTPDNLSAQRAMAGLAACVWTLFVYLFALEFLKGKTDDDEKLRTDYAFLSTLLFLTCYNVVLMGRTATWDIYCHAFMMGGIYFLWRGLYEDSHTWRWMSLAGLMMGLSFLSKGPVSFYALLLPFLVSVLLFRRPDMHHKGGPLAVMIVLCLALSSWWYIYLLSAYPEITRHVMHQESSSWADHNVRSWWYYWRFFAETGIWTPLMLAALAVPYWNRRLKLRRSYLFMIMWVVASWVLLSCMPEKKYRYLLPMMVPCCYSMAFLLCYWSRHSGRWAFRTVYAVTALFAVVEITAMPTISRKFCGSEENSIRQTRQLKALSGVPFYYDKKAELRIEIVYAAGRRIKPLDLRDKAAVMKALPCAILTHGRAGDELPRTVTEAVDTLYCGSYNDNHHPKTDKHYDRKFLFNVTLLKPKKQM